MYQSFYTGALGAGTYMAKMCIISNNLAYIINNGFKPKTAAFTDLLQFNLNDSETAVTELMAGNGVRMQRTYTSYDTAAFTTTSSLWCRIRLREISLLPEAASSTGASGRTGFI